MYNQYQNHDEYVPLDFTDGTETTPYEKARSHGSSTPLAEIGSGITNMLSGVFKHFKLENFDTGDILLILIILFLFLEGDNLELAITLGLMLLLGLGED